MYERTYKVQVVVESVEVDISKGDVPCRSKRIVGVN